MATTTNFGWETPDDTDLVKDGAAAMRTLGNSIDTSFVDLKGGTTNQVLAKNSNTDLDFKWVADATGIPATIIDAKGDLIAGTTADTADRLAVGTNGHVLTADSTTSTGLKWAAVAATKNFSSIGTGATTSGSTVTVTGISNQDVLLVVFNNVSDTAGGQALTIRFNSDSGSNYNNFGVESTIGSTYNAGNYGSIGLTGRTAITFATTGASGSSNVNGYLFIYGGATAGIKPYHLVGSPDGNANSGIQRMQGGFWNNASTITSISLISAGTFDSGSFTVYGSA